MKVAFRVIGIIVCLMLVATFLFEPVAGQKAVASRTVELPVADQPDEQPVSNMTMAPQWTRATHVWTEAEMAAAKPYPMKEGTGSSEMLVVAGDSAQKMVANQVSTFPASLAEGEVGLANDVSGLDVFGNMEIGAPTGYTYPAPYTRYTYFGKYIKEYPYKVIGKLFFVQNGNAYVCSAAAISTYAVWTAGHCVHDGSGSGSGWSYYTMFLPGYDNGKKAGGSWYGVELWSLNGWIYNGDLAYDMGGIVLGKLKRKGIGQKLGYLGFAYTPDANGYYPQYHWFGIGYPAASPFDGMKQVVCASSYAYSDTTFSPAPVGVGCDQTGGTSGGPWIMSFGYGYYLNGNMSYRYVNPYHPEEMFSPYFGDAAYNLWNALWSRVP